MKTAMILLVALSFGGIASPATLYVPGDHSTIQGAIDAAVNGDAVLVKPGTYMENIDFLGKAITVKGEQGPSLTFICGYNGGSVASFKSGEGPDSVLEGFTLFIGTGTLFEIYPGKVQAAGGGVFCHNASPTIRDNVIRENMAYTGAGLYFNCSSAHIFGNTITENHGDFSGGGGIACAYCTEVLIEGNEIVQNGAFAGGGGIKVTNSSCCIARNRICENGVGIGCGGGVVCGQDSTVFLINNLICKNSAVGMQMQAGGGIYCVEAAFVELINNTIANNATSSYLGRGGGIYCEDVPSFNMVNCILRENHAPEGPQMYISESACSLSYCNVEEGLSGILVSSGTLDWGDGMLDADPLFVDSEAGDYHLAYASPCRGSGDNAAVTEPEDFEGDPRPRSEERRVGKECRSRWSPYH